MLTVRYNERITQVSKGAPMGEFMRCYWHPIAATAELDDRPTKAVRILGEHLVLYKDLSGASGFIDALCPHRRVGVSYGIPEEEGLRCMYEGWMFDETGQCVEQPCEETIHPDGRFKERVKITPTRWRPEGDGVRLPGPGASAAAPALGAVHLE
jgi:5,5'-dehydrodivanillate O-demethylase